MINKDALIQNVNLEFTGGRIPRQRLEFDIITDVGEFHYDSDYCTYDEIQCRIHDLFTQPDANEVVISLNGLTRGAVRDRVRLTVFMELPTMGSES